MQPLVGHIDMKAFKALLVYILFVKHKSGRLPDFKRWPLLKKRIFK